jgi:hypothetical protein
LDSILRGAGPGDLPIEQPTTFDLYLNSTTASVLARVFHAALPNR